MRFGKSPPRVLWSTLIGTLMFLHLVQAEEWPVAAQQILARKVAEEQAAAYAIQQGEIQLAANYKANLVKMAQAAPASEADQLQREISNLQAKQPLPEFRPGAAESLTMMRGTYTDSLKVLRLTNQNRIQQARKTASDDLAHLAEQYEQHGNSNMANRIRQLARNPESLPAGTPSLTRTSGVTGQGPHGRSGESLVEIVGCEPPGMVPIGIGQSRKITLQIHHASPERVRIALLPLTEEVGGGYSTQSASIFAPGAYRVTLEVKSNRRVQFTDVQLLLESTSDGFRFFDAVVPLTLRWQ